MWAGELGFDFIQVRGYRPPIHYVAEFGRPRITLPRRRIAAPVTSLVLPAYNPGPTVDRTWFAVERFVAGRPDPWEAVFVLDGCTDGTPECLAELSASSTAAIRVVSYSPNKGKGHAVRTGLLAARGARRIFTDVDLAYTFDDVLRIDAELRAGAAVAIASREHPESQLTLPAPVLGYAFRRHVQGRVFSAVARTLLPLRQRDTQAGLKGMTAAVAEHIVPELRCNGFGLDCEFLTACARSGVPVAEVPVHVRYDSTASTTGMGATVRMLRELWQIRRAWRRKSVAIPPAASGAVSLPRAA